MMHSLPGHVKRFVAFHLVQIVSGSSKFGIRVIHQYAWGTRHVVYLKQDKVTHLPSDSLDLV